MKKETNIDFKRIENSLRYTEARIQVVVKNQVEEMKAAQKEPYTKRMEKLADRLAFLSAWVVDYANGRDCIPDETSTDKKYLSSTLRRIRRALGYSYTITPLLWPRMAFVFLASMTIVVIGKIAFRKIKSTCRHKKAHRAWIAKLKQVNHNY